MIRLMFSCLAVMMVYLKDIHQIRIGVRVRERERERVCEREREMVYLKADHLVGWKVV
jgi:hypothetical protein